MNKSPYGKPIEIFDSKVGPDTRRDLREARTQVSMYRSMWRTLVSGEGGEKRVDYTEIPHADTSLPYVVASSSEHHIRIEAVVVQATDRVGRVMYEVNGEGGDLTIVLSTVGEKPDSDDEVDRLREVSWILFQCCDYEQGRRNSILE